MNRNWLHYLNTCKKPGLYLILITFVILSFLPSLSGHADISTYYVTMLVSMILVIGLTFLLPPLLFHYALRKSSSDLYFALPISRKELLFTSIVFAFQVIYGCFLITSTLSFIVLTLPLSYLPAVLLLDAFTAFSVLSLLTIHTYIYLNANNTFDGIILLIAYALLPFLHYLALSSTCLSTIAGYQDFISNSFLPYICILFSPSFMSLLSLSMLQQSTAHPPMMFIYYLIALCIITMIAVLGLSRTFLHRPAEKADRVSDSPLARSFLLKAYLALTMLYLASIVVNNPIMMIWYIGIVLLYLMIQFLYHHKLQLSSRKLLSYCFLIACTLAVVNIARLTHGFGIAEHYSLTENSYLVYSYKQMDDHTELSFDVRIPVNEMEDYQEVLEILENKRHETIETFYKPGSKSDGKTSLMVYNAANKSSKGRKNNQYFYLLYTPFTNEELEKIETITEIHIDEND